MERVTVTERAVRALVREALGGIPLGDDVEDPVEVNDVVDPSAAQTDPTNDKFVPQTRAELEVAVGAVARDLPVDKIPSVYAAVKSAAIAKPEEKEGGNVEKQEQPKNADNVEEAVRQAVKRVLSEVIPPVAVDPADVDADEEEAEIANQNYRRGAYKDTALGSMHDVEGSTFDDIAKEFGFAVSGAKQFVDKTLQKAQWIGAFYKDPERDPDELEIVVLNAMNDYIDMLARTGELTPADVQLMKDHPDIIRELDGFREYLSNVIRRIRKAEGGTESEERDESMGEAKKRLRRN